MRIRRPEFTKFELFTLACVSGLTHSHAYEWKSMERKVQCDRPFSLQYELSLRLTSAGHFTSDGSFLITFSHLFRVAIYPDCTLQDKFISVVSF